MKYAGQFAQGIAANDASKFTNKMMKRNARYAEQDGVAEADRIRTAGRRHIGEQMVAMGASGFEGTEGTAFDQLRESATEIGLEALTARRRARIEAQGFKIKGMEARAAGKGAMAAGIFSGVSSMIEDAASAGQGG